ncbi:hypothetical protein XELAEV_18030296mg [Xenopus laevis]|uniref:Uncharacterized protein n=1 Tax=Xenopus laevis TaxID=8355 RepID=A0A974CT26_XENLA|nr:hypothetical protein XELAEV_18030296mg [Xenopus laevis]
MSGLCCCDTGEWNSSDVSSENEIIHWLPYTWKTRDFKTGSLSKKSPSKFRMHSQALLCVDIWCSVL